MIHFLSYYEPYGGLCNQLYLITNHIHDCYTKGNSLFIHKINIDIFHKKRVHANQVLDISKTNENIKNLIGYEILIEQQPETIEFIPRLCIYPVSSIEFLNCLEFHKNILQEVENIKGCIHKQNPDMCNYFAVHFRLDIDAIIHYTFGKEIYNTFMGITDKLESLEYFNKLDQEKIKRYCSFLMRQYYLLISKIGFNKPWYICTSITKWVIHEPMRVYLNKVVNFILENHGSYFIPEIVYQDRELNALVDLLILRESSAYIGFEGSSFSEGYCKKVNSIRSPHKVCYFIKEFNV